MGDFFIRFVTFTSNLVGWLILLTPGVGWDIMGYESEPLPSYPNLRNFSYFFKLITPLHCLLIRFIYRVSIPPLHQPDCPRNSLRLHAQCIDGAAGHPLRYVCLPPLDVHPYGVDPCGFHCLLYRWVLPLSAWPAFLRHHRDPSRRPMVELRQDLEYPHSHHPALAIIQQHRLRHRLIHCYTGPHHYSCTF